MPQKINVLLVDKHDVARTSISNILRENCSIKMIAEVRTGIEAVRIVKAMKPDVAILDMAISDVPTLDVIERIRQLVPSCRVLALTLHSDDEYILPIVKAGASGYLLKESAAKELLHAVEQLAKGQVYFGQHAAKILAARLARQ